MIEPANPIAALHAAYTAATGLTLPLSMDREQAWWLWFKAGLTPADVTALVRHHQALARQGKPARSLHFRCFVKDLDYAEEDLALIRAQSRRPAPRPNRESVERATGRGPCESIPPAEPTSKTTKEALAKMLDDLRQAAR